MKKKQISPDALWRNIYDEHATITSIQYEDLGYHDLDARLQSCFPFFNNYLENLIAHQPGFPTSVVSTTQRDLNG